MTLLFCIIIILQALICAFLASNLAEKKGQSSGNWFVVGLLFGPFGLIAAAGLPIKQATTLPLNISIKRCPDCAENINKEALVCKFCGAKFSNEQILSELIKDLKGNYSESALDILETLSITKPICLVPCFAMQ
jgi:hypothetical protein